jgi:hypothetical protein
VFTKTVRHYAAGNADDTKATNCNETRITTGIDQPNKTHRIFCEICYRYYSEINLTCCCQHQVCSVCFFAMKAMNNGDVCPFCRCSCLEIKSNIRIGELLNPENQDDKAYLAFKEQTQAIN